MQRLVEQIRQQFPSFEQVIQIRTIDGNGDTFNVFHGPSKKLTTRAFHNILREPACFYFFNVVSSSESSNPTDVEMIRRDICWLTDPLPPTIKDITGTSLNIHWPLVRFCGLNGQIPSQMLTNLTYIVEVAEGVAWREGILTRFINDWSANEYKPVFAISAIDIKNAIHNSHSNEDSEMILYEPNLMDMASVQINDLKASTWYHFRISIEYLGLRVWSESQSVATLRAAPSIPSIPRLTVNPVRSSFDLSSHVPARYELSFSWSASNSNGSDITKYQVFIKRFSVYGELLQTDFPVIGTNIATLKRHLASGSASPCRTPNTRVSTGDSSVRGRTSSRGSSRQRRSMSPETSLKSNRNRNSRSRGSSRLRPIEAFPVHNDSSILPEKSSNIGGESPSSAFFTPSGWQLVYENLHRIFRVPTPTKNESMWWLRVRAKNAQGWSAFSPVLVINSQTHPSLFSELRGPAPSPQLPLTSRSGMSILKSSSNPRSSRFGISKSESRGDVSNNGHSLQPENFVDDDLLDHEDLFTEEESRTDRLSSGNTSRGVCSSNYGSTNSMFTSSGINSPNNNNREGGISLPQIIRS